MRQPMPTVKFEGKTYSLRSRSIAVPDLREMDKISALLWLNQNTTPRGYEKGRSLIPCSLVA